jgi:transposase
MRKDKSNCLPNSADGNAMGILPDFTGTLVHDCLKSTFLFLNYLHALWYAHMRRALTGIEENDHQAWPQKMKAVLRAAKALRNTSAI